MNSKNVVKLGNLFKRNNNKICTSVDIILYLIDFMLFLEQEHLKEYDCRINRCRIC